MTFDASTTDPVSRDLLWRDSTPFDFVVGRGLQALVAIRDTLAGSGPDSPTDAAFLEHYDRLRAMEADRFSAIWSLPAAHAWTRRTFEALRDGPEDALETQLAAFPNLVRALEGFIDEPPALVHHGETAFLLGAESLSVPGAVWVDAAQSLEAGSTLHAQHADTVGQALALIRRLQPDTFEQLRAHLRVIALQPEDASDYPNASSSEFPGAVLLGACDDPYELADHLVHEHYHNRLFAIEGMGTLLEDDAPDRFYSPWRNELRSMRGLVHGAYVFIPVHDYWRAVAGDADTAEDIRTRARDRSARAAVELEVALGQVLRHAELTSTGQAVVAGLAERIDTLADAHDEEVLTRARGAVRAHIAAYDAEHQVGDV